MPGNGVTNPGVIGGAPTFQRVATTGPGGFALTAGTPTILTWTAPNDGQLHSAYSTGYSVVSSNLTGGAVNLASGTVSQNFLAGGAAAGTYGPATNQVIAVQPGGTVSLVQAVGVSGGAATVYANLWAN